MTGENIKEILRLSALNLYYVTPDPNGEVIILRDYDKGYLGVYRNAEKALELRMPYLNDESKAYHSGLLEKLTTPPSPIKKAAPKPKRK